jgi:excisionase family DNA binding protein
MDKLLTIQEVADKLSVSVATLYEWSRRGQIPSIKLSRRALRFKESEINAFLSAKSSRSFTGNTNSNALSLPVSTGHNKISATHSGSDSHIEKIIQRVKDEVLARKK